MIEYWIEMLNYWSRSRYKLSDVRMILSICLHNSIEQCIALLRLLLKYLGIKETSHM